MEHTCRVIGEHVVVSICGAMMSIVLTSPRTLNSLTLEYVDCLHEALDMAEADRDLRLVVIYGAGPKGFCAGGNVKELAAQVVSGEKERALRFFTREYLLDLRIHELDLPVVVLADGITMGGGLGLAAGADLVAVTEKTRMAMPETRIGFFPDVGATRWLFDKLPPGYPEYLGLLGPAIEGAECLRLGLASHLARSADLPGMVSALNDEADVLSSDKPEALARLDRLMSGFGNQTVESRPGLDAWVARHFHGLSSVLELRDSLTATAADSSHSVVALASLSERSPMALCLTLELMMENRNAPLEQAFARELLAAGYMISQPDYVEGVRARLLDKDDKPVWRPASLELVGDLKWRS